VRAEAVAQDVRKSSKGLSDRNRLISDISWETLRRFIDTVKDYASLDTTDPAKKKQVQGQIVRRVLKVAVIHAGAVGGTVGTNASVVGFLMETTNAELCTVSEPEEAVVEGQSGVEPPSIDSSSQSRKRRDCFRTQMRIAAR
jgi:hypothetical protein